MAVSDDAAFTVRVGEQTYTVNRILLGDWLMLKTHFGLTAVDVITSVVTDQGETVEILNVADPGVLIGLMVIALSHERPHVPVQTLIAEVKKIDMADIDFSRDQGEDEEADPTEGGDDASEAAASPAKSGKSAKRPRQPGTPR